MIEPQIIQRKSEHLRIVAEKNVSHSGTTLFEDVHLLHKALPELDFNKIDTTTEFFGKKLTLPLMITSMTGGADYAADLNRTLAKAASSLGIAFSVGSQRVMITHPELVKDFAVREHTEGVFLGNIGAVQLGEYELSTIVELVKKIEADGICVHLNPAQEMIQAEGHRNYENLIGKIDSLNNALEGRLLVKETGAGISPETLAQLASIGVSYVDVAGSGGTSWTRVEAHRAKEPHLMRAGETFSNWGIPTAFSVVAAAKECRSSTAIIASGGMATGLDVAKAVSLGASIGGFARPVLKAYLSGKQEGVLRFFESIAYELKTAMLLTGAKDLTSLRTVSKVVTGRLSQYLESFGYRSGVQS